MREIMAVLVTIARAAATARAIAAAASEKPVEPQPLRQARQVKGGRVTRVRDGRC
jgi:hypothetical protein